MPLLTLPNRSIAGTTTLSYSLGALSSGCTQNGSTWRIGNCPSFDWSTTRDLGFGEFQITCESEASRTSSRSPLPGCLPQLLLAPDPFVYSSYSDPPSSISPLHLTDLSDESSNRDRNDATAIIVNGVTLTTLVNTGCNPTPCTETLAWPLGAATLQIVSTSSRSEAYSHLTIQTIVHIPTTGKPTQVGRVGQPCGLSTVTRYNSSQLAHAHQNSLALHRPLIVPVVYA